MRWSLRAVWCRLFGHRMRFVGVYRGKALLDPCRVCGARPTKVRSEWVR